MESRIKKVEYRHLQWGPYVMMSRIPDYIIARMLEEGRKLKTNFTIPSEVRRIIFGANSFDEDATTFDSTSIKFDVE